MQNHLTQLASIAAAQPIPAPPASLLQEAQTLSVTLGRAKRAYADLMHSIATMPRPYGLTR